MTWKQQRGAIHCEMIMYVCDKEIIEVPNQHYTGNEIPEDKQPYP